MIERQTVSARRRSSLLGWMAVAPALIVTAPLTGMAFHFDERRSGYRQAVAGRDNPLDALEYSYSSIETFLDFGNFRPLGRFVQSLSGGFIFEAAEATGLAPHAVNGVLRLLAVILLAAVATRVVVALTAAGSAPEPIVLIYPLVLGTTLVANGRGGSLVYFPTVFVGAATVVLAICLAVGRQRDVSRRRVQVRELLAMTLLGAAAAMFHDLVYVAPPLAAVFVAARASAAGLSFKDSIRTAASARWSALSAGFLAVFVPTRLEIAGRCGQDPCYAPSDLSFSGDIGGLVVTRLMSGSPPSGWSLVSEIDRIDGPGFNFVNLLANSFLALLLVGVVAITATVAVRACAFAGATPATETATATGATAGELPERAASSVLPQHLRNGLSLGLFGAAIAGLPALLVSLSRWLQDSRIDYGWRDTVLVQVGWSFMISSVLMLILATLSVCMGRNAHRMAAIAITALVGVGLSLTLLANARLAQTDRRTPDSAITSQIATATISYDSTDAGNALRCALIDAYAQQRPQNSWVAVAGLSEDLDRLMMSRYGQPFCDPARLQAHRRG